MCALSRHSCTFFFRGYSPSQWKETSSAHCAYPHAVLTSLASGPVKISSQLRRLRLGVTIAPVLTTPWPPHYHAPLTTTRPFCPAFVERATAEHLLWRCTVLQNLGLPHTAPTVSQIWSFGYAEHCAPIPYENPEYTCIFRN